MRLFSEMEYFPGKAQSRLARAILRPRVSIREAMAPQIFANPTTMIRGKSGTIFAASSRPTYSSR